MAGKYSTRGSVILEETNQNDTSPGRFPGRVLWGTQGSDTRTGGYDDDIIRGWAEDGDPSTDLGDGLFGFEGNDRIFGGGGADQLEGEAGDDEVSGGSGDDELRGGDGADELRGDEGKDFLKGGAGNDRLEGGDDSDGILGGDGDDRLEGGNDRDALLGGNGADILDGGPGSDDLYGGDGSSGNDGPNRANGLNLLNDTFRFRRGDRSNDTDKIFDFENDRDSIELGSGLGVSNVRDALLHATVKDGDTVFRFDTGDVLIVKGIADPNQLRDDLIIL